MGLRMKNNGGSIKNLFFRGSFTKKCMGGIAKKEGLRQNLKKGVGVGNIGWSS